MFDRNREFKYIEASSLLFLFRNLTSANDTDYFIEINKWNVLYSRQQLIMTKNLKLSIIREDFSVVNKPVILYHQ